MSLLTQKYEMRDNLLFLAFTALYLWILLAGASADVIDVDAAQYASISMEMLQNESYLQITERGKDYLDKPPLLFWLSSFAFELLGLSNFAYKLPSLIASLFSLLFTYKLASYHYDLRTAKLTASILASSIGFIWINNDVKTDALMMSCFIFSVYHLSRFVDSQACKDLLLGSIGLGLGMLSKGPMGLVFPLFLIGLYMLLGGNLNTHFTYKWLFLPLIVGVILVPMSIGLYQQFDLQPDKVVNGKTGVSGLRFYFWEQSFGRITGENKWRNNTSFFYLFHSFLILYFPYTLLSIVAYVNRIKKQFKKGKFEKDFYLLLGSLGILSLLSFSSYKIPHYSVVIFPLAAIVIAHEFEQWFSDKQRKRLYVHHLILGILVFPLLFLSFWIFPDQSSILKVLILLLLLAAFVFFQFRKDRFIPLFILAISLAFSFNTHIIPGFQAYSEGRRFAQLIKEEGIEQEEIYFLNRNSRALEFYLERRISDIPWEELLNKQERGEQAWYYMSVDGKESLLYSGFEIEEELRLKMYDLNRIKAGFLSPASREENLEERFLIKFKLKESE
ncbi:MAG: glycosyltransferase family 39 protein [Bacteroidota bacterium]